MSLIVPSRRDFVQMLRPTSFNNFLWLEKFRSTERLQSFSGSHQRQQTQRGIRRMRNRRCNRPAGLRAKDYDAFASLRNTIFDGFDRQFGDEITLLFCATHKSIIYSFVSWMLNARHILKDKSISIGFSDNPPILLY
ncbi:hypothetical protein KWM_0118535 [Xanthomonas vasicola pv. musacearum NCPPB 2005]|nr:hypothetical protein KWQ_0121730 [Xanthomonas vasicola pv. musacearum NCPPB 4380]KFA05665.1 hypothetical protein KWM_0118535 [Xanthomonas vasicola pv. musacearum NCPPB 2005]KFA19013.1 hypothetical protein A11G_0109420 [Xanthomonas vasicola pv. musacearum NCPPB 4392]KFA19345.1 hypothetical protein KWU_0117615 [Xanthomonas vasicola pv. musacearum NCPPB 4394]KFA26324.1 hypothetical protein KWS_0119040 [Xanthomonas vasicola pv. musacearum NCPPB 4384]